MTWSRSVVNNDLYKSNEGQEIGLGSLGDQMNLEVSSKWTHHPNWV